MQNASTNFREFSEVAVKLICQSSFFFYLSVSLCTHLSLPVSLSLTLSVWYFQCLSPSLTAALSHTFTRSSAHIPAVTLMNLSE